MKAITMFGHTRHRDRGLVLIATVLLWPVMGRGDQGTCDAEVPLSDPGLTAAVERLEVVLSDPSHIGTALASEQVIRDLRTVQGWLRRRAGRKVVIESSDASALDSKLDQAGIRSKLVTIRAFDRSSKGNKAVRISLRGCPGSEASRTGPDGSGGE